MATQQPAYDHSAPEVDPNSQLPEVYTPPREGTPWSAQQSTVSPTYFSQSSPKQEPGLPATPYGVVSETTESPTKQKRIVCGCTLVVFILSIVIAILSAAVIGLAAGTGVAASNYNDANSKLQALSASCTSEMNATATTGGASAATATGKVNYSNITNGCSDEDEETTGSTYTPKFYKQPSFTMYCQRDAPQGPFYSLFVADFNSCMDACASWNSYNKSNVTCQAVSFVPSWTVVATAVKNNAPGSCYLKPGPQNTTALEHKDLEVHAAILKKSGDS